MRRFVSLTDHIARNDGVALNDGVTRNDRIARNARNDRVTRDGGVGDGLVVPSRAPRQPLREQS